MGRLEGKSVIITGAGSGIGRAASLLFTKEGARLIAVDKTEAVKETVAEVKKAGGVFYTPQYIVEYIVKHTVGELVKDKTPREWAKLRILDPACGSGSCHYGASANSRSASRRHPSRCFCAGRTCLDTGIMKMG